MGVVGLDLWVGSVYICLRLNQSFQVLDNHLLQIRGHYELLSIPKTKERCHF